MTTVRGIREVYAINMAYKALRKVVAATGAGPTAVAAEDALQALEDAFPVETDAAATEYEAETR